MQIDDEFVAFCVRRENYLVDQATQNLLRFVPAAFVVQRFDETIDLRLVVIGHFRLQKDGDFLGCRELAFDLEPALAICDDTVADLHGGNTVLDGADVALFRLQQFGVFGAKVIDTGILGHAQLVDVLHVFFAEDLQQFTAQEARS